MGSCAAPSAKGDDEFITSRFLQQCQGSWLMAHVRAFEFFGVVLQLLVPDNLKAAVSRADELKTKVRNNQRGKRNRRNH